MTRTRQVLPSAALAVASTLATLLVLEVGFRAQTALSRQPVFDPSRAPSRRPKPGARVRLGQIIRPASRLRVYQLIPDLDVVFLNSELHTSSEGFRGPPLRRPKVPGHVRIVGLGDSVMFGWGVDYKDAYLARFVDRVGREIPSVGWEALNTAVPGYNTVMEVETLREQGLAFSPDLVLLNVVGNDLGLPNFVLEPPDVLSLRHSFLVQFVRERLGYGRDEGETRLEPVSTELRRWGAGSDLGRIPPRLRDLAGLSAFRRAVADLAALSRERGFEVVLLSHPVAPDFAREAAAEHGFLLVETQGAVQAYVAANSSAETGSPSLTLSAADPHPSALGHAIIADTLYERLQATGLLAALAVK